MDTSSSRSQEQDFKVADLLKGTAEEERLAQKASIVVGNIVHNLKPILRYVSAPLPVLTEENELFLVNPSGFFLFMEKLLYAGNVF